MLRKRIGTATSAAGDADLSRIVLVLLYIATNISFDKGSYFCGTLNRYVPAEKLLGRYYRVRTVYSGSARD